MFDQKIKIFSAVNFFQFSVSETLDPYRYSPKMLDPAHSWGFSSYNIVE